MSEAERVTNEHLVQVRNHHFIVVSGAKNQHTTSPYVLAIGVLTKELKISYWARPNTTAWRTATDAWNKANLPEVSHV
jgi:hypothetical protein